MGCSGLKCCRNPALLRACGSTSLAFVEQYFTVESAVALDVLTGYVVSSIGLDEKLTAVAYCTRHPDESLAERAAWELSDIIRGSTQLIRRSRRKALGHIRCIRECRRKCHVKSVCEILTIALLPLGDRRSCRDFLKIVFGQDAQAEINCLKDDKRFESYYRPFKRWDWLQLMRGFVFLHRLRSRIGNRTLVEIARVTKQQWIRIHVGTILVFNGCPSGLEVLLQERANVPEIRSQKYMLLFGLAWGGVQDAAEEFKQIADTATEQSGLTTIYTLCHSYGNSPSHRLFFENVKVSIEGRIDPKRLADLRSSR